MIEQKERSPFLTSNPLASQKEKTTKSRFQKKSFHCRKFLPHQKGFIPKTDQSFDLRRTDNKKVEQVNGTEIIFDGIQVMGWKIGI